jgi:Concanavalin A-like lectin/glucanases superfamily
LTSRNDGAGLLEGEEPRTADEQDLGRAQREDGAAEREEAPADQGVDASRAHEQGQMNETSGQMLDLPGNNGTPTDVIQTGETYVFNGSTSHVPVPDADSLDPQENDITLTARVLVNGASLDDDSYDIVRKGYSTTSGGDYKMEILRSSSDPTVGRLHCLFRGSRGKEGEMVMSDIVDGNWHTLACIKRSTKVVAMVDGKASPSIGSVGSIANSKAVMVGAKTAAPLDDVFEGKMNYVRIHIGQVLSPL